jgi:predicted Zn finger-like uncharacterized protein
MFTVCPKCALTLVVTAADLRVAQGYVRCGRCSNVFNALARLSEDRQSAIAAAQAAPPPAPSSAPAPQPPPAPTPLDSIEAEGDDDEPIPETALEFNPGADVNKVFVEPPPNPEWTAATGSFKAIVLKNEAAGGAVTPGAGTESFEARAATPGPAVRGAVSHAATGTGPQADIELDADFLSATAAMRKLKMEAVGPREAAHLPSEFNTSAKSAPGDSRTADSSPEEGNIASEHDGRPAEGRPRSLPQPATRVGATSIPKAQFAPQPRAAPQANAPSAQLKAVPPDPQGISRPHARESTTPFAVAMDPPPKASAAVARARIAPAELAPSFAETPSSSATVWIAGTGALVILLAAQIVHHYRNDLAANAQLNRPVTALYAALGVTLTPRWDLHAYDVRQLGASVDSASSGQIMVRASVKNGAHQAQPMPLLRVTLQDRFGNRIAARDVAPQNYLPRAIPASSFLSGGQRIDAEMAFVDPGSNAVGFEIDACLPAPAGGIACANDAAAR